MKSPDNSVSLILRARGLCRTLPEAKARRLLALANQLQRIIREIRRLRHQQAGRSIT